MRELIELKLPQMVEARKREEEASSSPTDLPPSSPVTTVITPGHSHQFSQSSVMSDLPSPTFSTRGHSRMQSSTSSLPSSPTMLGSTEIFGSGKRPLTDVKEEPLERDEDFEMIDSFRQEEDLEYQETPFPPRLSQHEWSLDDPEVMRYIEDRYNNDESLNNGSSDYPRNPIAKRQRGDASPFSGLASRMGSRMPSLSRKWRSRKPSPSVSIPPLSREASVSRANSTRALSISSAHGTGTQPPPTPAASIKPSEYDNEKTWGSFSQQFPAEDVEGGHHDQYSHNHHSSLDSSLENDENDGDLPKAQPSTPLLPPLMTEHLRRTEEETPQSPLQSPKVAEPTPTTAAGGGTNSVLHSPISVPQTPHMYPSPPLSTKPSIASFRRFPSQHQPSKPQQHHQSLVPSSEIPVLAISPDHTPPLPQAPSDKWTDLLGHANFTITPEPYTPNTMTYADLRQVRSDYDLACQNFALHLARVEENDGPLSRTYEMTQSKWREISGQWRGILNHCDAQVPTLALPTPIPTGKTASSRDSDPTNSIGNGATNVASTVPTSPIAVVSANKFPDLGDQEIVGPMEVGPVREEVVRFHEEERARERKRKLGSYIRDWIQGLGGRKES